jgi:hypothetical protein
MLIKSSEQVMHGDNCKVYGLNSEQIIDGKSDSRNFLRLNLARVPGL